MNPYKDFGDICDPTDPEYDPLTGSWVPPKRGEDIYFWVAVIGLASVVGIIFYMAVI